MKQNKTEFWLRGALPDTINLLQPVTHALLQAEQEIDETMENFPNNLLWQTPADIASPAFHLQHIAGVLDRLFTYANGNQLSQQQLNYLLKEGKQEDTITVQSLLENLHQQMKTSVNYLKEITPETLTEIRYVGRQKTLSTQMGLLFHAAEHTMRHNGQLLVTVKIILNKEK